MKRSTGFLDKLILITYLKQKKPTSASTLCVSSVLKAIIPIERWPFYRDIFLPLPCKQFVQAFYKVSGVFERTAFQ